MHNTKIKSAFMAATAAFAVLAAQPVLAAKNTPAASSGGNIVQGIAVADLEAVAANSQANRTAMEQRQTTYKAQIDQAKAREAQLNAAIKPLADKFNADRAAAKPNTASLQAQLETIQTMQNQAKQDIQRILQPVAMSQAYVEEQVVEKLDAAVKAAMGKKGVSLLLSPDAVVAVNGSAYYLNQDILNELNTLIPSAQLVPPAGWEPRQVREAKAQQAAAQQQQQQAGSAAPTSGR